MRGFNAYLIIVFIIIGFAIFIYNFCTNLRNKCRQSKSSIDVYLTQRFDLIPNLVEVVKAYANFEQSTLENLAILRNVYDNNKDFETSIKLNNEIDRIIAVSEAIPDLKADGQFLELQRQLVKMESQLQAARRNYNGDVTLYNTKIQQFPAVLLASSFGFYPFELYKAEEYQTKNVDINL